MSRTNHTKPVYAQPKHRKPMTSTREAILVSLNDGDPIRPARSGKRKSTEMRAFRTAVSRMFASKVSMFAHCPCMGSCSFHPETKHSPGIVLCEQYGLLFENEYVRLWNEEFDLTGEQFGPEDRAASVRGMTDEILAMIAYVRDAA